MDKNYSLEKVIVKVEKDEEDFQEDQSVFNCEEHNLGQDYPVDVEDIKIEEPGIKHENEENPQYNPLLIRKNFQPPMVTIKTREINFETVYVEDTNPIFDKEHLILRHLNDNVNFFIHFIAMDNNIASELNKPVNERKTKNSAKEPADEITLRRRRLNAERVRAYRKRKKALGLKLSSQAELHSDSLEKVGRLSTDDMSSTSTDPESSVGSNKLMFKSNEPISEKILHKRRLNRERCRRYRQRHKLLVLNPHNFQEELKKSKVQIKRSKKYECDYCKHKFSHKNALLVHINKHMTTKYRCEICSKSYISKEGLSLHTARHTGDMPYECEICASKFGVKFTYDNHMRIHNGEKPFACNVCSSKFREKSQLTVHQRIHSGDKPYTCNFCSAKFRHSGNLKAHIRTHTNERPFSCEKCSAKFRDPSTLRRHKQIHSGEKREKRYSCEICSCKLRDSYNLKIHIRRHTGERPFACQICFLKFIEKRSLNKHMKIHQKKIKEEKL
ncbi:hypothetical protein KQX54_019413 [Cotesia glomerata]|uniref:C2H2-type domain-containing protein n=1 Tax=Cotesia glomerata TaxID=32391 RepID=A0AAV7IZC7_COTGL|nr:hypothetical protein KQX54_019413 [Cotesia glomerata]